MAGDPALELRKVAARALDRVAARAGDPVLGLAKVAAQALERVRMQTQARVTGLGRAVGPAAASAGAGARGTGHPVNAAPRNNTVPGLEQAASAA